MNICFDVDGTLIDYDDNPRLDIIDLLLAFRRGGFRIIVWSGNGDDYAELIIGRLGLRHVVDGYLSKAHGLPPGTAFTVDDNNVNFRVPNLYVGPR